MSESLHDDGKPDYQALALELCGRAFSVWQLYIDAMEAVRDIFSLASGRSASTPADLRATARTVALQVAAINTPLFMTTLTQDILQAQTADHRNASMKLVAFLVRKVDIYLSPDSLLIVADLFTRIYNNQKPLLLFPSLPRLVEAVVKSLDPANAADRDAVHTSATIILNELVKT